ncbi:MAG: hypothetical protein QME96_13520 [Myxococcota bacterium]|nr:hypothetical protein [Myxococcota bacterium]
MGVTPTASRRPPRISPTLSRCLAWIFCVWLVAMLMLAAGFARLRLRILAAPSPPRLDTLVLPTPGGGRFLAAGYAQAAADALWSRLLIYWGESILVRSDPKFMAAYLDAITAFDPLFRAPYAWAGHALPLSTVGRIDPENIEAAVRLLRAGLTRFPGDAELHGILGYNLFYELPRWITDRDRIARAKVEGAEHLRAQAAIGGGPEWLALSAVWALQDIGLDEVAARHLEEAAFATGDPELRKRILWRLAGLRANADIQAIETAAATLEAVRRDRAPYLSPGLFLLSTPADDAARMAEGLAPRE